MARKKETPFEEVGLGLSPWSYYKKSFETIFFIQSCIDDLPQFLRCIPLGIEPCSRTGQRRLNWVKMFNWSNFKIVKLSHILTSCETLSHSHQLSNNLTFSPVRGRLSCSQWRHFCQNLASNSPSCGSLCDRLQSGLWWLWSMTFDDVWCKMYDGVWSMMYVWFLIWFS